MSVEFNIIRIQPTGPVYQESRRVRGKVLREPLGMGPVVEVFPFELESFHYLSMVGNRVVGCVLFHPRGEEGRLYQMAVLPEYQRQGIGQALVEHLEADVRRGMTKTVFLHARHYAVSFYQGCGYRITGAPFQEVGLEHVRMSKALESIL